MNSSVARVATPSPNRIIPLPEYKEKFGQYFEVMISRSRQNWVSLVRRLLGSHILFLHGLAEVQRWRRHWRRPRIRDHVSMYQLQPGHIAWLTQSDAESCDNDDDGWVIARQLGDSP